MFERLICAQAKGAVIADSAFASSKALEASELNSSPDEGPTDRWRGHDAPAQRRRAG